MNLPSPLRWLLSTVRAARTPQTGRHYRHNIQPAAPTDWSAAEVEAARDWEDETAYLPVGQARARIRDQVDQFPAWPAEPNVQRRVRGTAEVKVRREFPDNTAPDRWFK